MHFAVWKISHMRTADERKQMMFAQRIELDVFDQNDLACSRLENRPVYDLVEILSIALREKLQARAPRDRACAGDLLDPVSSPTP